MQNCDPVISPITKFIFKVFKIFKKSTNQQTETWTDRLTDKQQSPNIFLTFFEKFQKYSLTDRQKDQLTDKPRFMWFVAGSQKSYSTATS